MQQYNLSMVRKSITFKYYGAVIRETLVVPIRLEKTITRVGKFDEYEKRTREQRNQEYEDKRTASQRHHHFAPIR